MEHDRTMTQREEWKSWPHAYEFLPREIERPEDGTMELCEACRWPRPFDAACGHWAIHGAGRGSCGPDGLAGLP